MSGIIFDSLKTRNLDQVYEINLNQYHRHLVNQDVEGAEIDDGAFVVRLATGISRPEFNVVLQTDITDNFDDIYTKSVEFFKKYDLPFTWYILPSTEPDDLKSKLESKNLRYIGDDAVVGIEIDELMRNISTPNSLYIEAISSMEKLQTWVDIYCKTRNISDDNKEEYIRSFEGTDFADPNLSWKKYIGWLNGKPVAASTLIIASGIATVYDETLLPKYKGFGIETSINLIPLKKAKKMGMKLGLIPTNIGSIKRFTGLGFKELFRVQKLISINRGPRRRRR